MKSAGPDPPWKLAARGAARTSALAILFLAAGTVSWPRGWIFAAALLATQTAGLLVMWIKNRGLIRIRLSDIRPTKPFDRTFVSLYGPLSLVFLIVAGIDGGRHSFARFGQAWIWPGGLLHLCGAFLGIWARAVNPHLTCTVETRGHKLVTRGPYHSVRHPMYAGRILSLLGWPLILGSPWSYIPACALIILFVYRTKGEDKVLIKELPGYRAYSAQIRYRLFPGVW